MDQSNFSATVDEVQFFIMEYPIVGFLVVAFYLLFTKVIGPRFMRKRSAYNLKLPLRFYDLCQVYLNYSILYEAFTYPGLMDMYIEGHCIKQKTFDRTLLLKLATISLAYYKLKIFDLMDTVFIILKKKESQLTFLHVFHHSIMVIASTISFVDKEQMLFFPLLLNSFVHVVMYAYYFIASFAAFKSVLWWKNYITKFQIAQFIVILAYLAYGVINQCEFGFRIQVIWFFAIGCILILFLNFYFKTYNKSKHS